MDLCTVSFIVGIIVAFAVGLILDVDSFAGGIFARGKDKNKD